MKKIYFVRHGQSEHNEQKRYAGQIDSPLTNLGRTQAAETGVLLQNKDISHIVSSTLSRAQETAQIIKNVIDPKGVIPFESHDMFQEANFGEVQGQPYTNAQGLVAGIESGTGESAQELYERGKECLEKIDSIAEGNILVVGHGSFTSVIFAVNEGKGSDDLVAYRKSWEFKNAEIRELS